MRILQLGIPGAQSNNPRGLYGVVHTHAQARPSITPAKCKLSLVLWLLALGRPSITLDLPPTNHHP